MAKFTAEQLANIQVDYGIVYVDFGESTQRVLGPTRGGATFEATQEVRDIEFDGQLGKTKGMQVVDSINAVMKMTSLAISNKDLEVAMPYLTRSGEDPNYTYTCESASIGAVANDNYFKNITLFAKKTGGKFVKVTLYNAMNEAPFSLAAVPKGEGTVNLEVFGHWAVDSAESLDKLFEITHVDSIA